MRLPEGLLREAVTAHIDKINLNGLRYWTQIPVDIRLELAAEANKRLAARNLSMLDEAVMLYRLRKAMNNWITRPTSWLKVT